jgi:hypothetical protein
MHNPATQVRFEIYHMKYMQVIEYGSYKKLPWGIFSNNLTQIYNIKIIIIYTINVIIIVYIIEF